MAEEKQNTVDFFISYNSADKAWAEWIAWQLEEVSLSTILQAWDFRPGGNFILKMQEASEKATRTIAILSPDYLSAEFTQPEWAAAFKRDPQGTKGILIPVMVRECKLKLKGLWSQIIYINLVHLNELTARKVLLEGIDRGRSKPNSSPKFPGDIQHNVVAEHGFPGKLDGVSSTRSLEEKMGLPKIKLNKPFNSFKARDEWIDYITSNLRETIESEECLDFYADNTQGKRQIRILSNQKTVYSLDIHKDAMGGSRNDEGISFSYAEGRGGIGSGFHASGNFKWDKQKEVVVLELLDMSLLSHGGGMKEYTKEDFLHALWGKIQLAIERSARWQ
jgi:TIR domain